MFLDHTIRSEIVGSSKCFLQLLKLLIQKGGNYQLHDNQNRLRIDLLDDELKHRKKLTIPFTKTGKSILILKKQYLAQLRAEHSLLLQLVHKQIIAKIEAAKNIGVNDGGDHKGRLIFYSWIFREEKY